VAGNKARIVIIANKVKHADLLSWVATLPMNRKSGILRAAIYEFMENHPELPGGGWSPETDRNPADRVELDWEILGRVVRNAVRTELADVQIAATPNPSNEEADPEDRETAEVKAHIDDMLEGWGGFDDDE
jgi:hypothetical protein